MIYLTFIQVPLALVYLHSITTFNFGHVKFRHWNSCHVAIAPCILPLWNLCMFPDNQHFQDLSLFVCLSICLYVTKSEKCIDSPILYRSYQNNTYKYFQVIKEGAVEHVRRWRPADNDDLLVGGWQSGHDHGRYGGRQSCHQQNYGAIPPAFFFQVVIGSFIYVITFQIKCTNLYCIM